MFVPEPASVPTGSSIDLLDGLTRAMNEGIERFLEELRKETFENPDGEVECAGLQKRLRRRITHGIGEIPFRVPHTIEVTIVSRWVGTIFCLKVWLVTKDFQGDAIGLTNHVTLSDGSDPDEEEVEDSFVAKPSEQLN